MFFIVLLSLAVAVPIVKARQWRQLAILSKVFALGIFNALFYLGALGLLDTGVYLGIYGGFYVIIAIILTMSRRVIPFFIEKGVENSVKLYNSKLLDIASLIAFLVFFIAELLQGYHLVAGYSALVLGVLNALRLIGWYTSGLWKKPLLWSVYLASWSISLGFILYYLSYTFGLSKFLAIHALAYGGIGMMTIGMMARVALGHTGRGIQHPPAIMSIAFLILLAGTLFRVFAPILLPEHYVLWVSIAMVCWIVAFAMFLYVYLPMLISKRIDGRFG